MSEPRVLWLNEYPTLNGGERSFLAVLPAVRAAGFEIVAAVPGDGPLAAELAHQNIAIEPFACHAPDGQRRSLPELREALAALIQRTRPALLHANSLSMGRLSGPVAEELNLPSISHLRDIVGLSRQAVADLNCHRRLLAVSAATREAHIAQGLDPGRVKVLYNGVCLERFAPRTASGWLHRELDIPRESLLIATVGQIIIRKGQDILARAAAELAGQVEVRNSGWHCRPAGWHWRPVSEFPPEVMPQLHYLLIGARYSQKAEAVEFERNVHRCFEEAGLSAQVHFLGVRNDLDRLLPEVIMLVHPARQEPLGRVLLEAAACGLPIIATDVGGTREIFPPESPAAILIPPDDPTALAGAIRELVSNPSLRQRLGAAARQRMEQAFDVRLAAQGLAMHYGKCIDCQY